MDKSCTSPSQSMRWRRSKRSIHAGHGSSHLALVQCVRCRWLRERVNNEQGDKHIWVMAKLLSMYCIWNNFCRCVAVCLAALIYLLIDWLTILTWTCVKYFTLIIIIKNIECVCAHCAPHAWIEYTYISKRVEICILHSLSFPSILFLLSIVSFAIVRYTRVRTRSFVFKQREYFINE